MRQSNDIDEIIIRRLLSEQTDNEYAEFDDRIKDDESFVQEYNRISKIWNDSTKISRAYSIAQKQDSVWRSIEQQTLKESHHIGKMLLRIAAVIVPLLAIGLLFLINQPKQGVQYFATTDNIDSIRLADNTLIILNSNSKISYLLNEKSRNVQIEGMAYFKVSPDTKRPFIVSANEATITVLGTEFSVENITERERVHVEVTKGKVAFAAESDDVKLIADQNATWTRGNKIKVYQSDKNSNWILGKLSFNEASLNVVIEKLLAFYPEIKGIKNTSTPDSVLVTTEFDSQTLSEVIDELNIHFDKKIMLNNGYLTITD